jgi:isoleucyl-tRNA synthetase
MSDLPKTFEPKEIEARWYQHWETSGLFRPDRPDAEPWTIVNPPPNVTGALHIGHALDNTLQDILTRHARLRGRTPCGSSERTMPASRRRWWSSATSRKRGLSAPISAG